MLRVDGLVTAHGQAPLSFDLRAGTCVGLLGSDFGRLEAVAETIAGMRAPVAGRVDIGSASVSIFLPRAAHRMTTLTEHVTTIASSMNRTWRLRLPVAAAISRLGVDPRMRLNTQASQSAAALIACLIPETDVAVLHDPFAGLNDAIRHNAIEWIRSLSGSATAIVVTGTQERDVRAVSHSVIEIGAGR